MDRDKARLLLQALRRGDKKALVEFMKVCALQLRMVCQHCDQQMLPLVRSYDFEASVVIAGCSLCGRENRLPMKNWASANPLQPPPAS